MSPPGTNRGGPRGVSGVQVPKNLYEFATVGVQVPPSALSYFNSLRLLANVPLCSHNRALTRFAASLMRLAVPVMALMAVAGISTSAQARTAADAGGDVAGIDPGQAFTALAASVLTRPRIVRATDERIHITYELVLTGARARAVNVERVDVRDANTQRVLLLLAGPELLSRMNPVGDTPAGVPPDYPPPSPSATLLAPSGSAVIWLDVVVQRKADVPAVLDISL
jgi:hypothetical protein